tara:strand:- start:946 stop:5172 length:4227 start_codon:yes stop_codon:yes gene_type:complete
MHDGDQPSASSGPTAEAGAPAVAHAVFEAVARRWPDRVAAVCADDQVTYAELDSWADAIATALREAGLRDEEPVGIASPRSIGQVAGVLGVLKAGGAYVPLIANQPSARLIAIAGDAGCRTVLADGAFPRSLFSSVERVVDPDAFRHVKGAGFGLSISPDRLAYIMYTSGSTGRPKGVLIEHSGVVRLVRGQRYMPFGPDFHFLYAGPLSFDLSTIEIFTPLLHGARLLIAGEDVLSPGTIRRFVEREGLKGVCVSFSLFRALFEADPGAFEGIPVIGVCGEPADPRVIRRAQERLPDASFYNAYGPTECTSLTTTHQIPSPVPLDPPVVPIGVPLERMRVRIVDERLEDVSPGATGELLIGGVGLARGYLNDPDLTAARFVGSGEGGARWYRSGDRVRMMPDGAIAYLGRADDQVKVRGQRIELGEIDAALVADPAIESAAAVVVGEGENAVVAACVVPAGPLERRFDLDSVLERVSDRLTRAMLPARLVPVSALPINRNGKIDRTRVAAIAAEAIKGPSRDAARPLDDPPRGPAEEELAEMVSGVLGGPPRGMDLTFLQAGGNSLHAMVLCMRVRERSGADLDVPEILTAPSLRSLAATIADRRSTIRSRAPDAITSGRFPMSPAQLRLWTIQHMDPKSAAYNITYRIEFATRPDPGTLAAAWQRLHERHAALRTRFSNPGDPSPAAELLPDIRSIVSAITPGRDSDGAVAVECTRPFDLAKAPLARLIVRDGPDGADGWLVMHHVISDAWSMEVILRDLAEMYRAIELGTPVRLPSVGKGVPAHAARAESDDDSAAAKKLAAQAASEFRGLPHTGLSETTAMGGVPRPEARTAVRQVSPDLRASVDAIATRHAVSPHAVWLGLYAAWVCKIVGRSDVAIGLAVSTRDIGGFENDVGFFVETVPVRMSLRGMTTAQIIECAADAMRRAQQRRRIPFDLLVSNLEDHPPLMRTPITDVFFNLIDRAPIAWPPAGESIIRPVCTEQDNGLARFDLLATLYRDDPDATLTLAVREGCAPAESGIDIESFLSDAATRLADEDRAARIESSATVRTRGTEPDRSGDSVLMPGTPQGHVLYTVLSVFREVLDAPGMTESDDFFRLGGNSLKAVRALSMLRDRLGVEASTVIIFSESTPIDLARALLKGSFRPGANLAFRMSPGSDEYPFYLLPGIEGNLISFAPLVRQLESERGCIGLEYPGLQAGSEPLASIPDIASLFSSLIRPPDPGAPAPALIGYSFGGVVAYELAMNYQRRGLAPGPLVLVDSYLPESVSYKSRPQRLAIYARAAVGIPTRARLRYIRRRVLGFFEGRRQQREEIARRSGPLFEANRAALGTYRAAEPYRGPVLIFRGRRPDWMITQKDDGANGWRACVQGPISVVECDAEHSELLREQLAPRVAQHIAEWVARFDT